MIETIKNALARIIESPVAPVNRLLDVYVLLSRYEEQQRNSEQPLATVVNLRIVSDNVEPIILSIFIVKGERTTSKIIAIKNLRQHYSLGLKEAKDYLDKLQQDAPLTAFDVRPYSSPRW